MEKEISFSQMYCALLNLWDFVDQKWTDGDEKKRMLARLEYVLQTFKSTQRMRIEKNKTRRMKKVLILLKRASTAEKRWINTRHKKMWGNLYGGVSSTPYSDLIKAQTIFPDKPMVWAFAKMLEEYIKQRKKGEG